MKIAVTYENGQVFQHFGRTSQFKIYDVENGQVTQEQVVNTLGSGHGALAGFLTGLQVDALICGGMGGGAKSAMAQAGITVYGGVTGSADEAVRALLAGALEYAADIQCGGHGHEQHSHCEGHCGEDMVALILLTVAGVAVWQVYVPVHEDNVSVNAYEDLRQFVRVSTPDPTIKPDVSNSPGTTSTPTLEPESTTPPTPQVDFESLRAVNPEIVAWLLY